MSVRMCVAAANCRFLLPAASLALVTLLEECKPGYALQSVNLWHRSVPT